MKRIAAFIFVSALIACGENTNSSPVKETKQAPQQASHAAAWNYFIRVYDTYQEAFLVTKQYGAFFQQVNAMAEAGQVPDDEMINSLEKARKSSVAANLRATALLKEIPSIACQHDLRASAINNLNLQVEAASTMEPIIQQFYGGLQENEKAENQKLWEAYNAVTKKPNNWKSEVQAFRIEFSFTPAELDSIAKRYDLHPKSK